MNSPERRKSKDLQVFQTKRLLSQLKEKKGFHTDNLCLKRGVMCGHVVVDDKTNKDTVLFSGSCLNCDRAVSCTFSDALDQDCYAGLDYEDGGVGGCVKCPNEDCPGMYLTGLCEGNPSLDSGNVKGSKPLEGRTSQTLLEQADQQLLVNLKLSEISAIRPHMGNKAALTIAFFKVRDTEVRWEHRL